MSNSLVHAFFVGRALAEAIGEQVERTVTDILSDVGKFDAEQRERLRNFTQQVVERADQAEAAAMQNRTPMTTPGVVVTEDLQQVIDDLRAETAQLRAELQRYRNRSV